MQERSQNEDLRNKDDEYEDKEYKQSELIRYEHRYAENTIAYFKKTMGEYFLNNF